jgi:hypothetical protein
MFQTDVVVNIKTHILCSLTFFRKFYPLRDNVEKYGKAGQATDDNIIRRMRCACWITTATDTHSEYLIFIVFLPQQWLRERDSKFSHTYTDCVVNISWRKLILGRLHGNRNAASYIRILNSTLVHQNFYK